MIEFKEVGFSYGSQVILSRLSFHFDRSDFLVVSGPTRSGKTTLVQLLVGLFLPTAGEIIIEGRYLEDIVRSAAGLRHHRRRIGGVGGIYSLLADRTVLENIALAAEISGQSWKQARRRAMETAGRYHLSQVAGLLPNQISEVERRAALLARAEAGHKSLIIADSPTDGLDAESANFINDRLAALHLAGVGVIYLTSGKGPSSGITSSFNLKPGGLPS